MIRYVLSFDVSVLLYLSINLPSVLSIDHVIVIYSIHLLIHLSIIHSIYLSISIGMTYGDDDMMLRIAVMTVSWIMIAVVNKWHVMYTHDRVINTIHNWATVVQVQHWVRSKPAPTQTRLHPVDVSGLRAMMREADDPVWSATRSFRGAMIISVVTCRPDEASFRGASWAVTWWWSQTLRGSWDDSYTWRWGWGERWHG